MVSLTPTMTALTLAVDALVLASVADVVTTRAGIRTGRMYEINPLMRWATRTTPRAMGAKAVGLTIIGAQLVVVARTMPTLALWLAWMGTAFTLRLAWKNYRLLRTLQADREPFNADPFAP